MSRVRDGVNGCRCCGLQHPNEDGYCGICVGRGHDQDPPPTPPAEAEQRAQDAPPRNRQIRQPRRDR